MLKTLQLHATASYYTVRVDQEGDSPQVRYIAMIEEITSRTGAISVRTYTTRIAIKNRLNAAKRYNLHLCGAYSCPVAGAQLNEGVAAAIVKPKAFYTGGQSTPRPQPAPAIAIPAKEEYPEIEFFDDVEAMF